MMVNESFGYGAFTSYEPPNTYHLVTPYGDLRINKNNPEFNRCIDCGEYYADTGAWTPPRKSNDCPKCKSERFIPWRLIPRQARLRFLHALYTGKYTAAEIHATNMERAILGLPELTIREKIAMLYPQEEEAVEDPNPAG